MWIHTRVETRGGRAHDNAWVATQLCSSTLEAWNTNLVPRIPDDTLEVCELIHSTMRRWARGLVAT